MERCNVDLFTNGFCTGHPGEGGFAGILKYGKHSKQIDGYSATATTNRMELKAIIESIKVLKRPCNITVKTDSQYICTGIEKAKERCKNGWRTKTGARCTNPELWNELKEIKNSGGHTISCLYINNSSEVKACSKIAKENITLKPEKIHEVTI